MRLIITVLNSRFYILGELKNLFEGVLFPNISKLAESVLTLPPFKY